MINERSYPKEAIPSANDITRTELPNGIVVLARANFNSPSITISGFLQVGSLFDPDSQLGLADFTASALMRGTTKNDFHQIYDRLETAGASLGFNGGTHTTSFMGRSLVEDLGLLLDLFKEVLHQPTFPDKQVEKLRAQILTGLALRAQSTSDMAAMAFDRLVYDQHPYSRPDEGYPETVQSITTADLDTFHRTHYGPAGMRIAIVGGIDPQKAVQVVQQALGDWQNPHQPAPPALPHWQPLVKACRERVDIPGMTQSDLVIGTAGPSRSAPDFLAAGLGNSVLGQFGLMGRIGEVVREQAGLAYYAYSSLTGSLGPGPWSVFAGVNPANEGKAADLILQELKRFTSELVSEEELADSKANFIGRLPLSLESNIGVAGALLHLDKHNLGLDYYVRYPDTINAITTEDVLAAAQQYLDPKKLATSIAGPPL
jgi:zinc protease